MQLYTTDFLLEPIYYNSLYHHNYYTHIVAYTCTLFCFQFQFKTIIRAYSFQIIYYYFIIRLIIDDYTIFLTQINAFYYNNLFIFQTN